MAAETSRAGRLSRGHLRTSLARIGVTVVLVALAARSPAVRPLPVIGARAVQGPAAPCAALLLEGLRVAEAWAWSLCFDRREACPALLAAQLPRHLAPAWLACAMPGGGP